MIQDDELVRRLAECGKAAPVIRMESRTVVAAAQRRQVRRSAVITGGAALVGVALFATVALAQPWSHGPVQPAGVSPTPTTTPTPEATVVRVEPDPLLMFRSMARSFLEDPAMEMSDAQRAMVERALDAGGVPFEDYRAAVDATFACFDAAGISHFEDPPTDGTVPVITYAFEAGALDAADACLEQHSYAIEALYQTQPPALAATEASFEAALPQLVACLREGGYLLDVPEPTVAEVKEAILVAMEEVDGLSVPEGEAPFPMSCLDQAGIESF
jgi:hypothetical protein